MLIGIVGGTFDPIHIGHLILAEHARMQLQLERVLFVPAGIPWRKAERDISESVHRLAMVHLAVDAFLEYEVLTYEIDAVAPSYTANTLAMLRHQRSDAELWLILGQDALWDLPSWRQPQVIVREAVLAVARRPGYELGTVASLEQQLPGISGRIIWLDMPAIDISATDIRRRVATGQSIRFLVPEAVEGYIYRHGLYKELRSP